MRAALSTTLVVLVFFATLAAAWPARAEITELRQASAVIRPEGAAEYGKSAITLPFSWDPVHPFSDGSADFTFTFPHTAGESSPQGLYFHRIGNRFAIWLNGALIDDRISGFSSYYNFGKQPRYYILPAALLKPENELRIRIVAEGGRLAQLGVPRIGPEADILGLYRSQYRIQVQSAFALAVIASIFGLMGLIVWWRERKLEFLYFSGAVLCWAVRLTDPLLEYIPMDWREWSLTLASAYISYVFLCFKFALAVPTRRSDAEMRMSKPLDYLFVPALAGAFLAIWFQWLPLWKLWRWAMLLFTLGGAGALIWLAVRRRTQEHTILAVAFTIGVSCGLADYIVTLSSGRTHGSGQISRYGALIMVMSFTWILMERYVAAQRAIQRALNGLGELLADRERELASIYEARSHAERESAVTEERQRITRDLHDGLGMQITTAMHLTSRPDTPRDQIARQLRETLEQLKLTVDALEDIGNDLGAVLGNIRFRLAARIESSGVTLHWEVDRLPMLPGLTSSKVRHIQFIVLEAISNAINHSGASNLTIRAWHDAESGAVRIAIQDDGAGFDAATASRGRGMNNMQARAQALAAVLTVHSTGQEEKNGTTVELQLPLAA